MNDRCPIGHQLAVATPESVLASPATSFWLKNALTTALDRDPVDAAADAELLATVLADHSAALLHAALQDGRFQKPTAAPAVGGSIG